MVMEMHANSRSHNTPLYLRLKLSQTHGIGLWPHEMALVLNTEFTFYFPGSTGDHNVILYRLSSDSGLTHNLDCNFVMVDS